jgi:transcription elongation factor GreB
MSKAFTREDDLGELPPLPRLVSPLAAGTKNYLTPGGSKKLHGELAHLREARRPPLVARARQDISAREELQLVDQRIAYLEESLRSSEILPPPDKADDRVRFGATVTVRDRSGVETEYRIVGVDETNLDRNWVSWQSPVARALLNASLGQSVPFKFPSGQTELEIVGIAYK